MPVLSGNISGSILCDSYDIPCKIISYVLTNKAVGNITVNLAIRTSNGDIHLLPDGLTLAEGDSHRENVTMLLPSGFSVFITSSGSCDYYFSLEGI